MHLNAQQQQLQVAAAEQRMQEQVIERQRKALQDLDDMRQQYESSRLEIQRLTAALQQQQTATMRQDHPATAASDDVGNTASPPTFFTSAPMPETTPTPSISGPPGLTATRVPHKAAPPSLARPLSYQELADREANQLGNSAQSVRYKELDAIKLPSVPNAGLWISYQANVASEICIASGRGNIARTAYFDIAMNPLQDAATLRQSIKPEWLNLDSKLRKALMLSAKDDLLLDMTAEATRLWQDHKLVPSGLETWLRFEQHFVQEHSDLQEQLLVRLMGLPLDAPHNKNLRNWHREWNHLLAQLVEHPSEKQLLIRYLGQLEHIKDEAGHTFIEDHLRAFRRLRPGDANRTYNFLHGEVCYYLRRRTEDSHHSDLMKQTLKPLSAQPAAPTEEVKIDKKALAAEKKTKAELEKQKTSSEAKVKPGAVAPTKAELAKRAEQSALDKAAAALKKTTAPGNKTRENKACRSWDKDRTCKYGDDCIYDHLTHGGTHKGKPRQVNPRTGSPSGSATSQKSQSSRGSAKSVKGRDPKQGRTPPSSPRTPWTDEEKKKIPCKHFKANNCNAGNACKFSHALGAGLTLLGTADGRFATTASQKGTSTVFATIARQYDDLYAGYPSLRNETLKTLCAPRNDSSQPGYNIMQEALQGDDYICKSCTGSNCEDTGSEQSYGESAQAICHKHESFPSPIRFGDFRLEDLCAQEATETSSF